MAISVPSVVAGAPIEADWGNTVDLAITELQTDKIGVTSGEMTGPLIVGPAWIQGRIDVPSEALFSHKDAPGASTGYAVNSVGDLSAIAASGRTFYVWNERPGGGHDPRVSITSNGVFVYATQNSAGNALTRKDYVDQRDVDYYNVLVPRTGHVTMTGPLTIARTDDNQCLVLRAPNHGSPYMSWYHGASLGAYSQVNFSSGVWDQALNLDWTMRWFIAGTHEMSLSRAGGLVIADKVNCSYVPSTNSWSTANFIAQSDTGNGSRMAIRHGGTVFQWRMHSSVGQAECLNADATGFIGIRGGAYTNASALSTKKDVRPLREGGDAVNPLIAAELLPSDADTVEAPPDIMALRPIVYRHAVEPQCVKVDDDGEQVGVEPESVDTVRGQEGRREHIGLIADEVQHVIPSAVVHDADGAVVGIDYAQVTVALLDHVQQLTEQVNALQEKTF